MPDRISRVKRFTSIHANARTEVGKSQEYMAMELGVTRKTIQNWESGASSPSFFQSLEWFRILGLNPIPYYVNCIYPEKIVHYDSNTPDEDIEKAFEALIPLIPISGKRALLYLFYGKHGSSPNAVLQMMLAHLHTPMRSRALLASLISQVYTIDYEMGNIVCPNNILPNIESLNNAVESAKNATIKNQTSYPITEDNQE